MHWKEKAASPDMVVAGKNECWGGAQELTSVTASSPSFSLYRCELQDSDRWSPQGKEMKNQSGSREDA